MLESVSDTRDIHLASQWLADGIIRHNLPIDKVFTAHTIFKLDGSDTLPIDHGPISELLLDDDLMFMLGRDRKTARGTQTRGSFFPGKNLIWLNQGLMQEGVASMASTIGHELRHALDFVLSGGKPFRSGRSPAKTTDEYLRNPQEVNARFTQALWAMAFDAIEHKPRDAHEALRIIDDCLYRLHLSRDMFPQGARGDRQHNRLRSRAIRYWTEVARLFQSADARPIPKRTMMDRIRGIIARFGKVF